MIACSGTSLPTKSAEMRWDLKFEQARLGRTQLHFLGARWLDTALDAWITLPRIQRSKHPQRCPATALQNGNPSLPASEASQARKCDQATCGQRQRSGLGNRSPKGPQLKSDVRGRTWKRPSCLPVSGGIQHQAGVIDDEQGVRKGAQQPGLIVHQPSLCTDLSARGREIIEINVSSAVW